MDHAGTQHPDRGDERRRLHQLLDDTAARSPGVEALRYRNRSLSYAELRGTSEALGGSLVELGVRPGDRVGIYLPNRIEVVQMAIACSRVGAVFVPINPMAKPRQLAHILRDSGVRCLVMSGALADANAFALVESPQLMSLITVESDALPETVRGRFAHASFDDATRSGKFRPSVNNDSGPVAAILYTSGSTGSARGVVVSHANLLSGANCVSDYLGSTADDRVLAALPLSFDYGLNQVLTCLRVGACCVVTNYSTPHALLQLLAAERITGLAGVPTMWAQLVATEWGRAALSLRYVTNSGGAMSSAVLRKLAERLPRTKIFCMYGLTEAFRSTYLDPSLLWERPGSIGRAVPGQEVLVLRDDGTPCDAGEPGELVHRGSFVSLGYWNRPDETARRFRLLRDERTGAVETAVWSGDLVRADEDGFLYFIGRRDDLIKTSGYRVSPTEVEEVAAEVDGVVQAVAFGVADDVGQKIIVAAVMRSGERMGAAERILQRCRSQLPNYMVPSEILLLDSLPLGVTGKPDRRKLADEYSKGSMDQRGEASSVAPGAAG